MAGSAIAVFVIMLVTGCSRPNLCAPPPPQDFCAVMEQIEITTRDDPDIEDLRRLGELREVALVSAPAELAPKLEAVWASDSNPGTPSPDALAVNDHLRTNCGLDMDVNRFRGSTTCATIRSE